MNGARNELFSGTALAQNQNGRCRRGNAFDQPINSLHFSRRADELAELLVRDESLLEIVGALDEPFVLGRFITASATASFEANGLVRKS